MSPIHHTYDALVVGAGGAGLRAAIELAGKASVAVLTKVYPTRSHTGAAQGGIAATLANVEEDHWEWHVFDTVKGSDYLGDQDAIEVLCTEANETVYELERMGLPFTRTPEGRIDQRRFGGHMRNYGEGPVRRACYAADRTGHVILHTLHQRCVKLGVQFFNEFQVLDLLFHDGACCGAVAYELASGELHVFRARAVILATGGFGRMYRVTANAHTLTGDGDAIALRRGIPLQDMEFYQFHPTGIHRKGILLSEASRGEGAILRNNDGERFMERYAPTMKDLAPRDMVSRSIYQEIRAGRGIGGQDCVHLDFRHLGRDVIRKKLPDVNDFIQTYLAIDPAVDLVPIQPTAHYAMGGVPTTVDGQVRGDGKDAIVPGLYAAGECACVSVHGANRLGTNSLLEIVVFGRRAGRRALTDLQRAEWLPLPERPDGPAREQLERLLDSSGHELVAAIRQELQEAMTTWGGVLRTGEELQKCLDTVVGLKERYQKVRLEDRGKTYNTDLLEAVELGHLLDLAEATVFAALARTESRGAHYREDYPQRDDANWLKHSLVRQVDGRLELDYKPVVITRFQPQERKY